MNSQVPLPRILIYQDYDCSILADYLIFHGFTVIITSETNVKDKLREGNYDLCVLGYLKGNIPGNLELLYFLRGIDKKVPIIFVSGLTGYSHVIEAFKAGVDDYIVRPYNLEELTWRVKALLRRCGIKVRTIKPAYKIGNYTFDAVLGTLKSGSIEMKIPVSEAKILALLCAYMNEVIQRDTILRAIWKDDNYFIRRSLDVHLTHLRGFLRQDKRIKINTIRGIGYSLVVEEESE